MKSRKVLIYLAVSSVILIILALAGKKAGWFGKAMTYEVTTEKAVLRDLTEIITANGKIQPETEVKITPDVSGEIVELAVKDGDVVKKGQFLLKIKPDTYISARDRAQAALNAARAKLARLNRSTSLIGRPNALVNLFQRVAPVKPCKCPRTSSMKASVITLSP